MKTLIGIGTFGNLNFTKLTIRGIQETARRYPVDLLVVVGKPGDTATRDWLRSAGIPHIVQPKNLGAAVAWNDIMDAAWVRSAHDKGALGDSRGLALGEYDNLIIFGNDVICYPGATDALIECAKFTDWEWICSSQYDARSLVAQYPEARRYFTGPLLNFDDFTARPWELHNGLPPFTVPLPDANYELSLREQGLLEPECLKDVRNLCLFKRSVFEKIGYCDPNFWPGGYFEDNDACYRARLQGVKACGLRHSAYFHFWSRTIHQETGSTLPTHFDRNAKFYQTKWGGPFDGEKFKRPFNGDGHSLRLRDGTNIGLGTTVCHADRNHEDLIVKYWEEQQ